MVRFAEVFPDEQIVSATRTQLGWTHFRQLIALDDPLERDFYAESFASALAGADVEAREKYRAFDDCHEQRACLARCRRAESADVIILLRASFFSEELRRERRW